MRAGAARSSPARPATTRRNTRPPENRLFRASTGDTIYASWPGDIAEGCRSRRPASRARPAPSISSIMRRWAEAARYQRHMRGRATRAASPAPSAITVPSLIISALANPDTGVWIYEQPGDRRRLVRLRRNQRRLAVGGFIVNAAASSRITRPPNSRRSMRPRRQAPQLTSPLPRPVMCGPYATYTIAASSKAWNYCVGLGIVKQNKTASPLLVDEEF